VFDALGCVDDDEESPNPEHRAISYAELVAALFVDAAIVRVVLAFVDHGPGRGFARTTARWTGEDPAPG
jgi:hypothetical protein